MYVSVTIPSGSVMAANGEMFVNSLQRKRTTLAFLRKVGKEEKCSICLNVFGINEQICTVECGHVFHHSCLASWLLGNNTCPLCRQILYENDDDGEEENDDEDDDGQEEAINMHNFVVPLLLALWGPPI